MFIKWPLETHMSAWKADCASADSQHSLCISVRVFRAVVINIELAAVRQGSRTLLSPHVVAALHLHADALCSRSVKETGVLEISPV